MCGRFCLEAAIFAAIGQCETQDKAVLKPVRRLFNASTTRQ